MSAPRKRKKWRVRDYPSFTEQGVPSMRAAYEHVVARRLAYADGTSHIHEVVVEFNDGDPDRWRRYEVVTFPERRLA